ncbi:hypothetical protein B0T11DRAFT_305854 [Plectosphaerella cucumerina]|uniref:Diels-Alderase n=1 Tax=Plectosphaerella cucumerina TaxID=40658 RepID=A0A8K0X367_9PEZI|nr:hypothetical protein B0T11DRAFT_305854 [Plectosphaerella cucumerina]
MRLHRLLPFLASVAAFAVSASPQGDICTKHQALRGEFSKGASVVSADPLTHFDSPMVAVFDESISENWSFDAASDDGQASIVVYFTRGTVANVVAAQRGLISVAWANGTRYMENAFVDVSTLATCRKTTSGLWENNAGNVTWGFTASKDFKQSIVTIKSPTINGTFELKSRGPAIYPGGLVYPSSQASVLFAPEMYWQEQFPVADAKVRLNIRGSEFHFDGVGGRDKNWNPRPWAVISQNWDMARAIVGPYGLMLWNYTSAVDGRSYFSAAVTKGDKVIFRTANQEASCSEDYGTFKLTNTGPVHLSSPAGSKDPLPDSRHTGYLIDLVSPKRGEHWRFAIDFSQTTFWFRASESLNVGQFAGKVSGGLMGQKEYKGVATGSVQELLGGLRFVPSGFPP